MNVREAISEALSSLEAPQGYGIAEQIQAMKIVMQTMADDIRSLEVQVEEHQRHIAAIQPTGV